MSVLGAVERDLEDIAGRDKSLARSALAETAKQLARELDGNNSATSKSMCAGKLMEALEKLRELAPERAAKDRVDELGDRRAKRRAARASG